MVEYTIYVLYALSGLRRYTVKYEDKDQFYAFVGRLYLSSIEKINSIWYDKREVNS